MKNKKAIIILILLVLALSITSVTASDNVETTSNNTETLTTVDSADLDEIENNDKLSMNNENIEDIDDSNSIDEELSKEYNVKDMEVLGDTYIPNPSVTVKSVSTSSLTLYIVDIGGKGQMPAMNVQIDSMDHVSVSLASGYTYKSGSSGSSNFYYYTGTLVVTGLSLSPGTTHDVAVWSPAANSNMATTSFTVPKTNPTIKIDSISEKYYNTGTYSISGTSSVNGLTITLKQGSTSLGTATVSNGKWTVSGISSTKFSPGSYTVTATSTATSSYNSASASGTLKVSKSTPIIKFSNSPSIYYGNGVYSVSGTATVSSNNVNEGKVTLSCGDVVLGTSSVSNGVWTVSDIDSTLIDPSSSSYTLTASFASTTNYNAASGSGSLTVGKFTPDIIIDSSSIFYNQSSGAVIAGKIYKSSGEYYEGSIDLYLNEELIASDVVVSASGSWSYTLSSTTGLSPATYSVGVVWKGNDYTNENTLTENKYTVNKGMVIPIITPPGNIDIGRSAYVHVDVNNVMGGGYLGGMTVTLQGSGIDGILEETSDGSGRATFIIPNLASGKYDDWKVSVISNDYYTPTMDSFSVSKFYVQYPLTVNITSVLPASSTYPEEIVIKGFTNAGDVPQGNVTLWLGGKIYTGFFDSTGNFTASLIGVKPGIYNYITAKYNPTDDEYYYRGVESVVSIPETVINKFLPEIKVLASSITNNMYPGNVTITGTVKGAQGYLIPSGRIEALYNGRVYGNAILDDDGSFVIYAYDLPRGEYNLTINYVGDDYYLNNTQSTENFTVNPSPVKFNITVVNGTYNVDEVSTTIQVELSGIYGGSDIAKGIIRLEINGRYWDATIDDTGRALVKIKSLNAGDYSDVILRYIKSDDELSFVDTGTTVDFTIFKADPGLSVRAPTIGAGKDGSIFITLNDNVSGVVNLTVGNFNIILNVTAGENRTYVINQPPVGANRVIANYSGDVNFNSSIAETMLYIERPESYLNYTVTNITYGQSEDLEFKIYLDEDLTKLAVNATGTIRVYGLDKNYKVDVTGGLAYLSVDKLTKGTWTIVAIYSGNDELGGSDRDDKFTVTGISTPLTITVDNSSVIAGSDIIVTVSVNDTINDPIKLYVDGKLYYSNTTVGGVTSFVLRNLSYASYNITAVFDGNDGFEGSSNNTTVSVYRIDVNPNIDILYNRDIVFNITVPSETSGSIRIKGNGTDTLIPITDNSAKLTLYNVTRGDYKFNISYEGNWKYLPFDIEKTFTVNPVDDYNLTIESTTAEFNKTVTIAVTAFGDLEGKIINLTVDGVNKGSAEVIGGVATFNDIYIVSNTTGEFEIIASYDGDSIYGAKSFSTFVPIIPTSDYTLSLKALDLVYVADNILINIAVPELINTLNITINGKTQLITRDNFIYHIDDIDEGEYNILVSYAGDKAYASKTNTTSFNVIKKDSNIIIETGDIYYNDDEVINISVSDGVSGYVLVTIDNKTSKYDLNGNATQIIRNDFTAGLHNVTVVYPGDRKYNSFTKTGNFTVFKDYDYNMVVSENGTVIGNNSVLHKFVDHTLVVDVSLPGDATGNLSFKLYDINHNLITNWTNVLPKNLVNYELREVTNYTLEIFYTGDSNYENNTFVFDINVHKFLIDANVSFVDNPYFVLSDSLLNITSNLNDRQIRVYIDGIYYTLTDIIHDNKTVINLAKLSAGNHTVSLMYNGDEYYTSLFATHNITVSKLESSVNVTATSVRTDNNVVVDVKASGNGSANIVILNGMNVLGNYNITITNGKGSFILPNRFVNGTYDLIVTYLGDEIYYPNVNSTTFNVTDKIQSDLNITRPTFIVNTPTTVDVTTNFPTGTVSVYVDGIRQDNITVNNRAGIISLAGLSAGNHTILVTYAGDYNYTELTKSFDIFVEKHNSTVNVTATSVRTGNPVVVSVNASGSGSANIVIFNNTKVLGSYNITISNGKGSFIIPLEFTEGDYNLNITYYGDDIYYGNKNITVFTVTDRIVSDLNITRPVFVVNTPSTVDVTANFPSGTVSVYVDGIRQDNITINSKIGIISLAGLSAGNHTILVTYAGDYNYTELTKSFDIFVEKHNSTVNVTATSVRTGNDVVVNVNASGSGSANIVIFNESSILASYNITINNGVGYLKVPYTFKQGEYNLNITYYGDDVYYGSKNATVFTVTDRIVSDLNITRPVFVVNTPSTVDVTTNFPTGTVSVYVDGKKQNNINIDDGKGVIDLEGLSAGNHTIQLSFDGNYDYTNATESFNIFVEKLNSSVNVTATSVRTGNDVIVNVNASGSGSANIVILNGTTVLASYNITIDDGKGYLKVPYTFIEGNYNLNITYYGDDIYYGNRNTTVFTVTDRIQSVIDFIEPACYIVNKTITIGLSTNFPTGEITVYVDGKKQTTIVNINNNEGTLDLGILSNGNHTIQVTYNGDYDYTETSNNITIDVLKLNTTIAITVDKTFYVDDLVEITINVNKSATGYISVNVNNKDYRLKITEGVAKLNITDLKENTYTIYAEYLGDDYFYGNNTDDAFTVSKIPVSIVIPDSIVVGDDLVIDFTNTHADNDEITGVLNITIGSENIIVNVVKGMASIPVSRLPEKPDTYDVVANYSGNYKFNDTILNTALVIKKLTTHTASADVNVTIDENLTVIITGDRGYGVDGNLTVSVNNGDSFIIPVNNGIAVIPSDKLPQETRDNTISISYANGTFYADKDFTLNVHSDKITVYDFIISNATVRFGENATIEITLPKDVTTSLTVKINDESKTVNIENGYGKLENIANLHAGDNSVTATFTSNKYETGTANANIRVNPNDMTLNITVPVEQLYVDNSATILIQANVSANVPVTVYINGKAETKYLSNGETSFTIDKLVYGEYVFTAIFNGDENYTYTVADEKLFTVDKNNITLNVTSNNVIVGHPVNIKVNINDDATGLIIVKVNNVEYSLNITNKEYNLTVPDLGNGTYTILAKYYGDSKYYGFENTTTIEVLKLTPSISANETILIGEDLTIIVGNSSSLVANASGKLNLTIDGFGTVEADVVNGIAVIKANVLPQQNNTYSASVNYYGDNNYYSLIQAITFTINKVPEVIITVPSNVTIDDELIITVGDSTTDGKLNVTIGSGNEFSVNVVNGTAVIPVSELPQESDNYNISIYYHSGSYWNNLEYNTTFHADKITVYPFNITNPTIRFGENATLEITLPTDVNTTLTIKINDITSTVDIKNGYGKLENISGLHAKANSVSATFGNGKYETSTVTSTIQVDPNDMTLTITVPTEQLYVDQSATISIKANVSMNNTVTVYVNGKAQTVKLTNGEGGFTITPLVYGDYVFTAIFDGNENYTYTTAGEKSFSVDKINITLNVTTSNVVVGHDINITVSINDDATGLVIVKVDNSEYSLNVGNKEYSLGVSGLGNGTHNIVVKYYGDDKYYGDENSTTVEILKLTPSIAFSSDILIAEDFIISITNSSSRVENPSGKLIFTINGNPVEVDVVNGVATIKASDLPVTDNTYTALVEYSGDNNYYSLTESVTFTINKVPRLVITVPGNVTIDDELIISVGDDTTDGKLNVTIGSGEKFTVNVINGTATIPVKYLPQKSNIYAIALDYYEGSYWNDTSVVRSFHADKITDYQFIISNDTIKFDGIATLRFTLPGDVNTTLTVIIDDIVKTVSITDGHGVLSIANLHAGVNLVSTSFGNDKYETSTATSFIRVLANEITLNITVPTEQLYVDQSATVSVQANVSMNNSVIVYVNGEARTLKLSNGKAEFTINPLVYGKYVFTALFEGNENYTRANAEMKSFTVDKNTPSIIVSVEDILVDENAFVIISNLPEDSKGIVLININGTVYSINTVKGEGNLTVSGLKYGKYDVIVNFTGDDKYHSNINTTSFSVWKNAIGEIKVRSETIKDNKTQVTVTVDKIDATGEVIITTPNGEYVGKFLDGKTVIEVTDLSSVETPFNITYVGDAKYLSNTTNGVIVNEGIFIESWVTVSAPDIMVDEKTLISVNVPDDATGFVKITVNGKTIQLPLVDAVATFKIGDLSAGEQTIIVKYLGDDKYYNSTNSTTFQVNKYSTSISVEADDGVAGTPITVTVKANASDVNGNVTVTVNGVNFTGNMENGMAVLNVTIDNAGDNVITAVYEGNTYYNSSTASGSVNMDYADAFVNVDAWDINVGEDAVIIVTLPDDATGNVTLTLNDNTDYKPVIIENGTAKFSISDLSADTYNVVVNYLGDNKYSPQSNGTVFVVSKVEVSPSAGNNTSVEVIKNDNGTTTINITVPDDATGNVTVTVDGKNYTVPIVNGTASVTVDNLNNDSNVSITYSGDDKYDGFNQTTVINSDGNVQFTPTLTITTQNINVGDTAIITVNLPCDATGGVTITVNGQTYVEAVSNGSAVFNVSGLNNATHIITASYNGDKKYLKASNTSSIAVSKIKTSISVKASDIRVGDSESITVTLNVSDATGSVSITVDGKDYTSSISGGQAVFSINALAEGTYTIKATYNGDNKYLLSSNDTVSFTVSKNSISPVGDNKTSVEVTPNDNGTATVTVNVPSDATGNVTVTVDGKNYTVPVVNGTASVVVDDYTNGSNISVSYSGDDKYDGFNHTGVLSDDGVKFNIDMTVTSDKEVYVAGETAVITITLPEDSTGNVTIMVNNKPVDTVLLSSGNIVFDYVIPSKGGFTVEAVFNGNKKYTAVHNSTVFAAVKANSTMSINVDDTPYDKNPVIEVILPDDASGNVTITVAGKDYTEEVRNGKAVFNLPLLDRDTYTVTAVYSGDDKYNGNNNQSKFDVVNKVADLDIKVDSIVYGETSNVTVTTSSGVTGYVTVTSGDNTYFAFIENGTAKLSVPNLEPGLNNITIYYSGDNEYQEKTVTSVIPVARLSSVTEVFVEDITQGEVLNVTVRVSGDASGNVTITIAGKNYTGTLSEGMVIIPVSGLGPGNYTVTALYLGDKYYNESSDVSNFVVKANMTVFAYEMTRGYNSGMDYSVYLTDDLGNPLANTNVVISVGGVDYNVRTDSNGIASLNAKLAVGSHTISIVNPVTGEETHSNLTIAPRLIENKNIVTYYNSGYVYKVRVIGDDGNPVGAGVKFTIKINGKSYTYTTDKDGYLNIKIDKRFKASSSKKNRVYKISLSYKGYTVKNTITIKQVLKSKRIVKVKKSAKRIVLKAKLKQGKKALKGKVIKFKFKGKTYKAKTNKKGIAKVKISKKVLKKLKAGKNYKVKITYLTDTIKTYVKVKK